CGRKARRSAAAMGMWTRIAAFRAPISGASSPHARGSATIGRNPLTEPRMPLRLVLRFLVCALLGASAAAQLAQPGQPPSWQAGPALAADVPAVLLAPPDVNALLAEDDARDNWPFRYGAPLPCTLGCDDAGVWEELPGGALVWRLHLVSPGARSLGVLF